MKNYLKVFMDMSDEDFLKNHVQNLLKIELPQTYEANHSAMDYAEKLLNSLGLETERPNIDFDGKTVCQDKVMPLCWSVNHATLTVLSEWEGDRVIADYQKEPFSVIRCSVSTPKEGVEARLIPWERMKAGENCTGALILLPQNLLPTERALPPVLDSGAIGLVSGGTVDSGTRPDDLLWANNCSETNCWHVIEGDRDFIGYSVSPNVQRRLEEACAKGEVVLRAECDGRRFAGKMPVVTSFLKGKSEKEFWILAHNGEPMEDDNNAGIILSSYTMYAIKTAVEQGKIPPLEYSVRLVLAPELYGFAAIANMYGPVLKERCIGAINNDAVPTRVNQRIDLGFAPPCVPFYSNLLLEGIWREYQKTVNLPPFINSAACAWSGDSFLSDPDIGLPTIYSLHNRTKTHCWHNSYQRFGYINYPMFARVTAVYTAFVAATVCPNAKAIAEFLPTAADYSIARLREKAETQPLRAGTDAVARIKHLADVEIANIRDFERVGVEKLSIDAAVEKIKNYLNGTNPLPAAKKPSTFILEKYKKIYPERLTLGIPHDFAKIPFNRRLRPYIVPLLSAVFSGMDGKKSLKDLIIEAEWDLDLRYTDEEIEDFVQTLNLLAEFEYIKM